MTKGKEHKNISPLERLRWLEALENGKGITNIAKNIAHRDIRIVIRHIEIAREERQITNVKQQFLLGRVEQHQEDLMDEARRLKGLVTNYPPPDLVPNESLRQRIHSAFKDHISLLHLKKLFEDYQISIGKYNTIFDSTNRELKIKETEIVKTIPHVIIIQDWTQPIMKAIGFGFSQYVDREYKSNLQGKDTYEVLWGAYHLTATPVTDNERTIIFNKHKEFLEFAKSFEQGFIENRKHTLEIGNLITEELDTFMLKRMIPGKCKYCLI